MFASDQRESHWLTRSQRLQHHSSAAEKFQLKVKEMEQSCFAILQQILCHFDSHESFYLLRLHPRRRRLMVEASVEVHSETLPNMERLEKRLLSGYPSADVVFKE